MIWLNFTWTSDGSGDFGLTPFYPPLLTWSEDAGGGAVEKEDWYTLQNVGGMFAYDITVEPHLMVFDAGLVVTGHTVDTGTPPDVHPLDSSFTVTKKGHPTPISFTWDEVIYDGSTEVSRTPKVINMDASDVTSSVYTPPTPPSPTASPGECSCFMENIRIIAPRIV